MKIKKDELGDRIKTKYEQPETSRRVSAGDIVVARIDGRSFSNFTKGMDRPFDRNFAATMQYTAQELVKEFKATVGYVQSDEISLVFYNDRPESIHLFDGKYQKLVSTLAASATSYFTLYALETNFAVRVRAARPTFDCRVFSVPDKNEASNTLLWRNLDCVKNAKSQFARSFLSPRQMHGKTGNELVDLVKETSGHNFHDLEDSLKYGCFYRIEPTFAELSEEIYLKIPEGKRPASRMVQRNKVAEYSLNFVKVHNRIPFIFEGAPPDVEAE